VFFFFSLYVYLFTFSIMASANLHINGFLQKCSRVPEWQSEYSFRWSGDHKNAEKHCVDPNARSSWKMVSDIRTKGIVAFRNSESTFRCWSITTTQRGMAASELRNLLGMEVREQPATQLYSCRVKKDNEHIIALANSMKDLWDPDKNSA